MLSHSLKGLHMFFVFKLAVSLYPRSNSKQINDYNTNMETSRTLKEKTTLLDLN